MDPGVSLGLKLGMQLYMTHEYRKKFCIISSFPEQQGHASNGIESSGPKFGYNFFPVGIKMV